jgi:hypothetical protein
MDDCWHDLLSIFKSCIGVAKCGNPDRISLQCCGYSEHQLMSMNNLHSFMSSTNHDNHNPASDLKFLLNMADKLDHIELEMNSGVDPVP